MRKERTRERLLEAARRCFAEDGLVQGRTLDIAKAAGVSHGTVFVHFPTRDDLLHEVVSRCVGRAARRLHALSGEVGVREILRAHLDAIGEDEPLHARIVMEAPLLPLRVRDSLMGIHSAIGHHLGRAVQREIEAGRLRPTPLPFLFNCWLGLINHYLINRHLFAPEGSVVERHGEQLVAEYMRLLSTDDTSTEP